MSFKLSLLLAFSTASLSLACAPAGGGAEDEQEEVSVAQSALAAANASYMNGTQVNGTFHNGVRHNGVRHNGVRHNGVRHNGVGLEGEREDNGVTVSGTGYAGVDLEGELGDSTVETVHIESVSDSDVPGMNTYELTFGGVNICGSSGARALILPGRWDFEAASYIEDATKFTIACRGAAIAKCTEWGYESWGGWTENNGSATQLVAGRHFQEACTRMVRADYCGDGVSHTENGTAIEVYDTAGFQTETPGNTMPLEAEWSASGASCVKHVRWTATTANPNQTVEDYIDEHCPSVWAGPTSTSCGGATSEYFTANGFTSSPTHVAPHATRPLLRNASDQHTH